MNFWPSADTIQYWSGLATIAGVILAFFAIVYAARQLKLARSAGSGASLVALTECFRQNWELYLQAKDDKSKSFALADLINMLEAACALHRDKIFYGHSRKVLEIYLIGIFRLFQENEQIREKLSDLLQTRETFENIRVFITKHKPVINSDAWRSI